MLGASTAAFVTPFALGYARHAGRNAPDRGVGRIALVVAALETLGCSMLLGGWLWNQLG